GVAPVARERIEQVIRQPHRVEAQVLGAARPRGGVVERERARGQREPVLRDGEPESHRVRGYAASYGDGEDTASSAPSVPSSTIRPRASRTTTPPKPVRSRLTTRATVAPPPESRWTIRATVMLRPGR